MKRISMIVLSLLLVFALAACGSTNAAPEAQPTATPEQTTPATEPDAMAGGKTLVAYYSNSGNTKAVAELIAESTGADMIEIMAAEPYTADDLDSKTEGSRVNMEQADATSRPAVAETFDNAADYDVIFVGYPIWLGQAPKVVNTFLESADLSGKTVIPFCTSGNSDITDSLTGLKASASGANWLDGQRFAAGATMEEVSGWVKGLNLDMAA